MLLVQGHGGWGSDPAPVIVIGAGQSGLAAARVLSEWRIPSLVLEAGDRPAGSWPHYYDSLEAFSPAGYSSLPGVPFPSAPDRYPSRDEVANYLEGYAAELDVEILTNTRVETIQRDGAAGTRHMMVRDPDCYIFAPAGGLFEPCDLAGAEVYAGDRAGWLHFVEDVDRAPIEIHHRRSGTVWMASGPGRVQRGDVVCVVMNDYDDAAASMQAHS